MYNEKALQSQYREVLDVYENPLSTTKQRQAAHKKLIAIANRLGYVPMTTRDILANSH